MNRTILLTFVILLPISRMAQADSDSLAVQPPRSFGALTIWLLDKPAVPVHPYLTLEQALQEGSAVIHENNSQTLAIENRSDTDVFVESSDLIKGGQQDRMVQNDMIVPGHTATMGLDVFCVEHDRSTKRGDEPLQTFSSSAWRAPLSHTRLVTMHTLTEQLLTPHVGGLTAPDTTELNLLKSFEPIATPNGYPDAAQESVWNDVSTVQRRLTQTLKDSVTRNASPSSLELTLENLSLADREHSYASRMKDVLPDDTNAVGFVYAVDNQILGADCYCSHLLFQTMWGKIVRALLTESTMSTDNASPSKPSHSDVEAFLSLEGSPKSAKENANDRTQIVARKTELSYSFQTFDTLFPFLPVHTAWIARSEP